MWVNPKFRDQVEQPRPPQESGQRLATFPRGEGAELRVNLSEYQGRPFVSLRVWEKGRDGALWPVKGKGCSVRLAEASGMIDALQGALAAAGGLARQGGAIGAKVYRTAPNRTRTLDQLRVRRDRQDTNRKTGYHSYIRRSMVRDRPSIRRGDKLACKSPTNMGLFTREQTLSRKGFRRLTALNALNRSKDVDDTRSSPLPTLRGPTFHPRVACARAYAPRGFFVPPDPKDFDMMTPREARLAKLISLPKAAVMLGETPYSTLTLAAGGQIKGVALPGRALMIERASVESYLANARELTQAG